MLTGTLGAVVPMTRQQIARGVARFGELTDTLIIEMHAGRDGPSWDQRVLKLVFERHRLRILLLDEFQHRGVPVRVR